MENKKSQFVKFEYFLNAIHYCIYPEQVWSGKKFEVIVRFLYKPMFALPLKCEFKEKMKKRLNGQDKEIENIKYGEKYGLSIGMSHYLFECFYFGYSLLFSFIVAGFAYKVTPQMSQFYAFVLFAIPTALCYIPAYRAVFENNKYLKYFKQFKKEDHQWRKTWRVRTIAFCLGSVFATILGIVVMWGILLM